MVNKKSKSIRKIIHNGIYGTILADPARSGKGVSSVIPTLMSYSENEIVLDFEGENFDIAAGFRLKSKKVSNEK